MGAGAPLPHQAVGQEGLQECGEVGRLHGRSSFPGSSSRAVASWSSSGTASRHQ
jgi:hypothetical protein